MTGLTRRGLGAWGLAAILGRAARADTATRLFRVGSGRTDGTAYPLASIITTALSRPRGGLGCADGGACGVPGLLAIPLATQGAVGTLHHLAAGGLDAGLAQADVAGAAQGARGGWDGPPLPDLRAIGCLYREALHVITRRDAGITGLADLRGRVVATGAAGSGTALSARSLLAAAGLAPGSYAAAPLAPAHGAAALLAGRIDAMIVVEGWPAPVVADLAGRDGLALLAIAPAEARAMAAAAPGWAPDTIAPGAYPAVRAPLPTLSVAALLVTRAHQPEALIHAITRILWNDLTLRRLARDHPIGRRFDRARATEGLTIALHPGAARYYREAGLMRPPLPRP